MGKKAFAHWAAAVINRVRTEPPPEVSNAGGDEHTPVSRHPFRKEMPEDLAYFGYLRDKLGGTKEHAKGGCVVAWADGSSIKVDDKRVRAGGAILCARS